jgi:hypothetical protein
MSYTIDVTTFLVEVLRRDTASSAIVATGMDAFGDRPWQDAQMGVFAFRHDWANPIVERLEWQTSVVRLASGNESRQAVRTVPRHRITYNVGNARQADALVSEWLADHLGKMALWPLPQYAVHLTEACERGATAIDVTNADWLRFDPLSANALLDVDGVHVLNETANNCRLVLIVAEDGWQVAQIGEVAGGVLSLMDPLARAVPAGSAVMPLVFGKAIDQAVLTQWVPGIVSGEVHAQLQPAHPPNMEVLNDPLLDAIPVWPDGNWRDDPTATVQATITCQDFSPAGPWVRRDDPWPTTTFQRRYLAKSRDEIEIWLARLWRTQGRLGAFWMPDGLAPIMRVTAVAGPEDGFLRVDGKDVSAFWHRPAACLIVHPDGYRQYALTATCQLDQGGVLVLRSELNTRVPVGSCVIRLLRCRLDHDAIDLYWHSPTLMEITLTARQLPERDNDDDFHIEYQYYP